MKNKTELDNLVSIIHKYNMGTTQTIFANETAYNEISSFLKLLGSSGVSSIQFAESKSEVLKCERLSYGGVTFNIVKY